MSAGVHSFVEMLQKDGCVRSGELIELMRAEVVNAAAESPSQTGLSSALGCIQGADEESLSRLLGRGPGGKGAAPRVLALALLHLTAAAQQQHHGPHPDDGGPSAFGALAGAGTFVTKFKAELHRVRGVIAAAHEELLARVLHLGQQLPPIPAGSASSSDGGAAADGVTATLNGAPTAAANGNGVHLSPSSSAKQPCLDRVIRTAAELGECARLRDAADRVGAELVALDDCIRDAVDGLARLAAAFDNALVQAAMAAAAAASGGQLLERGGSGGWLGGSSARTALQLQHAAAGLPPLTAVCSHSSPGRQGKYIAGKAAAGQGSCSTAPRLCVLPRCAPSMQPPSLPPPRCAP
jgi:hypothetical protein